MRNLYYCSACEQARVQERSENSYGGFCNIKGGTNTMIKAKVDCFTLKVEEISRYGYYIFIGSTDAAYLYLHDDGTVRKSAVNGATSTGWFKTKEKAKIALKEFQQKMCKSANIVSKQIHLQLENETSPIVQPITARLVTDHSGGRIVLQVQTPDSPEFIAVARLAVKDGKVVMFREQGVDSEFINTDSQGRIQN